MSSLSIAQTNSLQDQRERESLRSQYSAKAPNEEPMPAPVPTRASIVPPAPTNAMWTPDMGITFGGAAPPSANSNVHNPAYPQARATGPWDANRGIQFG